MNPAAEFIRLIELNPAVAAIMSRLDRLGLPDTWLVSGCLFQTVWNVLAGDNPTRAIKDYDLFYFDSADCSSESEEAANRRAATCSTGRHCTKPSEDAGPCSTWPG